MRLKRIAFIAIIPALLMLNGCAIFQHPKPKIKYVHVGNDPSMVALNKIAEKSERSTQMLAQIQRAKADSSITLQGARSAELAATATPASWGKKLSISGNYPYNKILATLASQASYQYYEEGRRPANVRIVTVDAHYQTLKQTLLQVTAQMPKNVTVAVHPNTRSLVVDYGD
jgi:hypothetical protein